MKLLVLLATFFTYGLAATVPLSILDINKAAVGDIRERPSGHETTPYKEGLPDPYIKFAETADPHAVLGE